MVSVIRRPVWPRRAVGWLGAGLRLAAFGVTVARLVPRRSAPAAGIDGASGARRTPADGLVSVVIPARDEEHRLEPCLAALIGAVGVGEVIVVDDRSSDGTAALAARHGARVVVGAPLPKGWAGKAWALQQGIEVANHEVVVTLDADTRPAPSLIGWVRSELAHADFVSVAGRFECPTPGTAVLHPALLTTLVYRFGIPGGVAASPRRAWANGQCMAFRRSRLLAVGGLGPVADHVVEDIALARHLAERGWIVAFAEGAEHLEVRMFESFADTWHGWGRSIALPGVEPIARQWFDLAVLVFVQGLPLGRLLARVLGRRVDPLDLAILAMRFGTLAGTHRAYRDAGPAYWLSPLADPVAVARLALSIVRPPRTWRGRTYPG